MKKPKRRGILLEMRRRLSILCNVIPARRESRGQKISSERGPSPCVLHRDVRMRLCGRCGPLASALPSAA